MSTLEELVRAGLGGPSVAGEVRVVRCPWSVPWWEVPMDPAPLAASRPSHEDSLATSDASAAGSRPMAPTLGGTPLVVADMRTLAAEAHERGELLWMDNTIPTSAGCAALRLGADVAVERLAHACGELGEGLAVIVARRGASPDAFEAAEPPKDPAVGHDNVEPSKNLLAGLAECELPEDELARLGEAYEAFRSRRRQLECDAAQAIASYLVCHPRVAHVWYPGLLRSQKDSSRPDPANALAPSVLNGGFGPVVDYATTDDPGTIRRHVARAGDPLAQVAALELALA